MGLCRLSFPYLFGALLVSKRALDGRVATARGQGRSGGGRCRRLLLGGGGAEGRGQERACQGESKGHGFFFFFEQEQSGKAKKSESFIFVFLFDSRPSIEEKGQELSRSLSLFPRQRPFLLFDL